MTARNRRRFLEDSLLASTAALAAAAVPGRCSLAAEEERPAGPNDKLRVACVGVRGRGGDHCEAFANHPATEIVAICDVDELAGNKRCDEVEKMQGKRPKYVVDVREICDDKDIDVVATATPNHWHALVAIWAIQGGKDVYVEKPVSHNVSEGRRIVEAARKYNKIVQTGTQSRSNTGMQEAIQYVQSGALGRLELARGLCYKWRPSIGHKSERDAPDGVHYDLWLGPAPVRPFTENRFHYNWHWHWDYGNGDLGNQGIHQMDLCRWALQWPDLGESVVSYGGRFGYEDDGETANTQVCLHRRGDAMLVFEVRGLETEPLRGAGVGNIFHCADGDVVMTSYSHGAAYDKVGSLIREFKGGGDHYDNFIQAVKSRKVDDLSADILEGHLSSALCHLGNISYRLGAKVAPDVAREKLGRDADAQETFARFYEHLGANGVNLDSVLVQYGVPLSVDGAAERFRDNSEADAMLTREYRAPFVVPEKV